MGSDDFLDREFFGIHIVVYFIFLFGIVCVVWMCCIIALCVGYERRRRVIKARGMVIRKRSNSSHLKVNKVRSDKTINSLSPSPNSKSQIHIYQKRKQPKTQSIKEKHHEDEDKDV